MAELREKLCKMTKIRLTEEGFSDIFNKAKLFNVSVGERDRGEPFSRGRSGSFFLLTSGQNEYKVKGRYTVKKEQKQIAAICACLLIGCILGCFVAAAQISQFNDPEYIALWADKNMPVPEPLGYAKCMISFALLFSGIPTGLIFYKNLSKRWLTAAAPKIIIGVIAFPIYSCIGAIASVPFIIYKESISIIKKKSKKTGGTGM